MSSEEKKLKFATVGTSPICEAFLINASQVNTMEYIGAYSRDMEKAKVFGGKYGATQFYDSFEEMANNTDIDAIYIASPNSMHYDQSKLFLQNKKHVLCEKPLAVNPKQITELIQLANKEHLIYMEAICNLYYPQMDVLKDYINKIGKVEACKFNYAQYSSKYDSYKSGNLPNIFNPSFATGALMDLGVYCVYMAISLFGEPNNIISSASFLESGADAYGFSIFEYDKLKVLIHYSKTFQGQIKSEINGEFGSIVIDSIGQMNEISLYLNKEEPLVFKFNNTGENRMIPEIKMFYNYVTNNSEFNNQYKYSQGMALKVSRTMTTIRKNIGLSFPME